ncbi:two-component system, OmpR family, response regulator MprA [Saccharopolyspora shandongensis]|uniref:Two-component system, OmpR family, response regulator MprA n=1 Tax=Saccharopolyspora shandongensis TaxID=418495 RepID=A0A1H2R7S9_9PSEU|nr:response regulator transcription factor [Saccharopolyspora shandongensis]SDW15375.1 two-component system, OmpR family, response regulator MprA [Saccharopolyspora shandongensis]
MRVLVVEDESGVRDAVVRGLQSEGYETRSAGDGARALTDITEWRPDAIVLDLLMPFMDGLTLCRRLRSAGDRTPILVLTARDAVADRIAGLDAGADDYLVKPFDLDEMLARVRALLRRSQPADDAVLRFADLTVDTAAHRVLRADRLVELSRTEFALLEVLLRNADQTLPRETITERVWGADFGPASNSLEVYVRYLRRKLEAAGEPRLVHTVRGIGYRLGAP